MEYLAVDPERVSDPGLRADLLDTWIAATDAGGSVGFVAPAPVHQIADTLDLALERVAAGKDLLGVLHNGDRFMGWAYWSATTANSANTGEPSSGSWSTRSTKAPAPAAP